MWLKIIIAGLLLEGFITIVVMSVAILASRADKAEENEE